MDNDLQPEYTAEQMLMMEHSDAMDNLRTELNAEWMGVFLKERHRQHVTQHFMRKKFAEELRTLLASITPYNAAYEDIKALLKKHDVLTYAVIYSGGKLHGLHSEELELELALIPVEYSVYHLSEKQKEIVLRTNPPEQELPL